MELTDKEAQLIKEIYNAYYSTIFSADYALAELEKLINGDEIDLA
jgi:hypothetical protein